MGSASLRKREMKKRLNPKGGQPAAARLGAAGAEAVAPGPSHSPSVEQFDALLARHRPFADSDYLHEQLHLRYQQRLATISERLPAAGALASALEGATDHRRLRTIGDPVVRHAIHEALRQVWNEAQPGAQHGPSAAGALPLPECAEVLREAAAHLGRADRTGGPLESGGPPLRRLGTERWHGSVWTEEHRDDVFGRCFRRIVRDNFRGEPLCAPSPADVAMLAKGAELLGALLPLCARSVLGHTHLAVVVPHVGAWSRKGSCSEFRISGTIFLNRQMLGNPWWVAEHLLHESLHQKLYDFRHTHSLLAEDLTPDAPPAEQGVAVHAIWNLGGAGGDGSAGWDTFRTIAAFHVYVHLAVLGVQIERRKAALVKRFGASPDGCLPALTHRREALERAHYLGRRLREVCWPEMGPAGRLLVSWLGSVLNALDPGPPPPDSRYLHLVLNRYMLEGSRFAEHEPLELAVSAALGERVADEGETVRRVMLTMRADDPEVEELALAMARRPDEGGGAAFLRFRGTVARLLHARSPDGYGLRTGSPAVASAPLDHQIRAMVDDSSRRLEPLLATLTG